MSVPARARVYPDSSFLVAVYCLEPDSIQELKWLQRARDPLPFTPLHRHELRTAIRLRVFRGQMSSAQRNQSFADLDSDLADGVLVHTHVPWTDAFQEAEGLGSGHGESLGVRSLDLLHAGIAVSLKATHFLTFDSRQAALVKASGLRLSL